MLWREPFATKILGPCSVPSLPFDGRAALLGCIDPSGFRELEVWRRLCVAELNIPYYLGAVSHAELKAITPSSRQDILRQLSSDWQTHFADATVFALIGMGDQAEVLMLGSPTEDAWDEFLRISSQR